MEYLVIGGIVLAIIGYLVYTIRSGAQSEVEAENKNATLQESRKVAEERIKTMEDAALKEEYNQRAVEKAHETPHRTDHAVTSESYWVHPNKTGTGSDDLN